MRSGNRPSILTVHLIAGEVRPSTWCRSRLNGRFVPGTEVAGIEMCGVEHSSHGRWAVLLRRRHRSSLPEAQNTASAEQAVLSIPLQI